MVGGTAFIAGNQILNDGGSVFSQQEAAPNILIEINNKLDQLLDNGGFPPGPPDFVSQLDCIADLLNGERGGIDLEPAQYVVGTVRY